MRLVHLSRRVISLAVVLVSAVALLAALSTLVVLAFPRETTFNVVAETERLDMKVDYQLPWRWTFEEAVLRQAHSQGTFSGSLQLGFPVQVTMERVGHGDLSIAVTHQTDQNKGCNAATLFGLDEEAQGRTSCEFDILVSDISGRASRGRTTVLTLEGDVSAGRPIGFQTQGSSTALLRSGRVTLREKTMVLGAPFDAGTKNLEAGDFFRVGILNQPTGATGFVVVDERPAMTTAFRVVGKQASIERPGGGEVQIATGITSRLANDPLLQWLLAVISAIVSVISVSAAIVGGLDRPDVPAEPAEGPRRYPIEPDSEVLDQNLMSE